MGDIRETVRQLLAAGLVDELRLVPCPVFLKRGKRLFGDDAQASAFKRGAIDLHARRRADHPLCA